MAARGLRRILRERARDSESGSESAEKGQETKVRRRTTTMHHVAGPERNDAKEISRVGRARGSKMKEDEAPFKYL